MQTKVDVFLIALFRSGACDVMELEYDIIYI